MDITVTLINDDPFGNNVVVADNNAGQAEIFRGYMEPQAEQMVQCAQNGAGFGNISTTTDGNSAVGHSFLHEGDTVRI